MRLCHDLMLETNPVDFKSAKDVASLLQLPDGRFLLVPYGRVLQN